MKSKIIGYCGVDSGQLVIIDPCYLNKWTDGDFAGQGEPSNNSYDGACRISLNEQGGGEIKEGGVVVSTGYGDGNYPVKAFYNSEGRIMKIVVNFNC